jgi:hypothetical protein
MGSLGALGRHTVDCGFRFGLFGLLPRPFFSQAGVLGKSVVHVRHDHLVVDVGAGKGLWRIITTYPAVDVAAAAPSTAPYSTNVFTKAMNDGSCHVAIVWPGLDTTSEISPNRKRSVNGNH